MKAITSEIEEIQLYEFNLYKGCFKHKDQSKVDQLMNILTIEDRTEIFNRLFNPTIVTMPELEPVKESGNGNEA